MRTFVILIASIIIGGAIVISPHVRPRAAQKTLPPAAPELGRYTIVFSPHVRADTYLLDTKTGTVWQPTKYTDVINEPTVWSREARADSTAELVGILNRHGFKPDKNKQTPAD